jgi:hypothetical protein
LLLSVERLNSALGLKHRRVAFQLTFNMPLSASLAADARNYHVVQTTWVRRPRRHAIPVRSARYNPASNSVILAMGPVRRGKPLNLTLRGVVGAETAVATIITPL